MKKLLISLLFMQLGVQAQSIKISLAKNETINTPVVANQTFEFTDVERQFRLTFVPESGLPMSLDNGQVKKLLAKGNSFSLINFKVPNQEQSQIPVTTKKIIVEVSQAITSSSPPPPVPPTVPAVVGSYAPSGYIIRDALKLAEFIKNSKNDSIKTILDDYKITQQEVEQDSFLKPLIPPDVFSIVRPFTASNFSQVKSSDPIVFSISPQSGFLNPTAVADALGTFIAKRFKEEINIAYLEKFKKFLKEQEAYRTILPQTYDVLRNKEPYQYTVFLQALHEAFDEDMKVLPGNGLTFLENFDTTKVPKIDKPIFYSSLAVLRTVEQAYSKNIVVALGGLENSPTLGKLNPKIPVRNVLKFTGLLARTLRISEKEFVKEDNLKEYLKDSIAIKCFLGLLRQTEETNLKAIFIDTLNNDLYSKLTNSIGLINKIHAEFNQIAENIQRVRNAKIPMDEEKKGEKVKYFIDKVEPTIQIIKNLSNISKAVGLPVPPLANTYIAAAEYSLSISRNVIEKDYSLAFNGFYSLIDTLSLVKNSDSEVIQALLKYGLFAANVAEAETGAEMLQALETAALPVGSYRIKRNNFFNVSINSFGGVSGGYEEFEVKGSGFFAPSAPVGLYLGWGTSQNKVNNNNGRSNGFFVSLLDVGAIFALRLYSPNTTALPEISWNNIFTPGIYYVHGIRKSPFSFGLGVQKAPELRFSSSTSEVSVIDRNAWRLGFKFTVDIPLFNVYTKANNGSKFKY